ncbi:MAG: glycosyltransferase family 2 protein [Candidatus Wenzhouxiangella sp. M2_3B_020]
MTPARALNRVTVLIVNYNAGDWLARAVESVRPAGSVDPELIVVDNGSTDASLDALDADMLEIDRAGTNLGFAGGINRAAAGAEREFLLLLNPDCRIEPGDLERLVAELDAHPDCALVSGRILGLDGREQRASRRLLPTPSRIVGELLPFRANGIDLSRTDPPASSTEVEAVSGACMLVRREAFEQVDGLDAGFPLHFEDLDFFARLAEAGWTVRWTPDVAVVHAGGQSSRRRPVGTLRDKHVGLWRYLRRHCSDQWPRWQRPLWFAALGLHFAVRAPLAWVLRR